MRQWIANKLYQLALWYVCRTNRFHRELKEFLEAFTLTEIVTHTMQGLKIKFIAMPDPKTARAQALKDAMLDNNPLVDFLKERGSIRSEQGGHTIEEVMKK